MLEPFEIRERVLSGVRPPVSPSVPVACASLIRQSWYTIYINEYIYNSSSSVKLTTKITYLLLYACPLSFL